MVIAIHGKIGSGKDTAGAIIKYLTWKDEVENSNTPVIFWTLDDFINNRPTSSWEIKKFAEKLKQICSILTGIPRADFEKQEVKNSFLSEEWRKKHYTISEGKTIFDDGEPSIIKDEIPTVRWFLQRVGTEAMRNNIHENVWVNALFCDYKPIGSYDKELRRSDALIYDNLIYPDWVITDLRFENERQAVKKYRGITLSIRRPGTDTGSTHLSETSLDNAEFDYIINNDGSIDDLIDKIKVILIEEGVISF